MFFSIFSNIFFLFLRTNMVIVRYIMSFINKLKFVRILINKISKLRFFQWLVPFLRNQRQVEYTCTLPRYVSFSKDNHLNNIQNNLKFSLILTNKNDIEIYAKKNKLLVHKIDNPKIDNDLINYVETECHIIKTQNFILAGNDNFQNQAKSILVQYFSQKPYYYYELGNLIKKPINPFVSYCNELTDGLQISNKSLILNKNNFYCITDSSLVPTTLIFATQDNQDNDKKIEIVFSLLARGFFSYFSQTYSLQMKTHLIAAIRIILEMLNTSKFDDGDINICSFLIGTANANIDSNFVEHIANCIASRYSINTCTINAVLLYTFLSILKNDEKKLKFFYTDLLKLFLGVSKKNNSNVITNINYLLDYFDKYKIPKKIFVNQRRFSSKDLNLFFKTFIHDFSIMFNSTFAKLDNKLIKFFILHSFV